MSQSLLDPSPAHRRLREVIEHAHGGYVRRWATAAALPEVDRPRPERLARTVAAHLLDLGYDASHLAAWATEMVRGCATAAEVLDAAVALDAAGPREFTVLAVLINTPERPMAQKHKAWLSSREAVAPVASPAPTGQAAGTPPTSPTAETTASPPVPWSY